MTRIGNGASEKRIGRPAIWSLARYPFSRERRTPSQMVVSLRLRHREINRRKQITRRHCFLWMLNARTQARPMAYSRYDQHEAIPDLARHHQSLLQYKGQRLPTLGRPRHHGLRTLERFCDVLGGYGANLRGRIKYRKSKQQRKLRTGQLHLAAAIRAIQEQASIVGMEIQ